MSAPAWIALTALAVWGWLLLCRGFFWRTDQRLPSAPAPDSWPDVAVVVPARDEAAVLPAALPSLLAQEYPGRARIVLVDDGSTDGTGGLARALAERHSGLPLRVVSPGGPEPGWTGKLWALRHGIAVAREQWATETWAEARAGARAEARAGTPAESRDEPEYLLLTDADIAHAPDSLRTLVAAARAHRLDLVSQMARLRVGTGWERLVVPAFVYFFCQLYPFRWVNRPRARTAAAAGGCVLLRTAAADRAGVPAAIRGAVIDDVALARAVRGAGGRIWLGLADRVTSVRPYPGLGELWRMVSRSAYTQLRHSPVVLAATVAGLVLVYVVPPLALVVGALSGDAVTAGAGAAAWAVMAATYLPMLRYYGLAPWSAVALPFTAALYALMTVDSAIAHHRGRGAAWKGRTYAGRSTGPHPRRPAGTETSAAPGTPAGGRAEG
ncbi:glycosyltransferase [Streptomyces yaizuensis]|uniref:Glycosyltransferase n=1 Tax=Streptomyces yaizuensis TaxID=2989713 RepID=A0ABQ5P3A4_9ACTN|nr:glycosyltransferase [Streptomyces sp. YSPA8]GLF97078.1 glycosyltransferase [Streptomyces sp. YSPA8]